MRKIVLHRHAARYLARMPADRQAQIRAALQAVTELANPATHPNVRPMSGEWRGCLRLRVGDYRAIFHCVAEASGELLEVLLIGPRGDVYE